MSYLPPPSSFPPGSIVDSYRRDSGGMRQDQSTDQQLTAPSPNRPRKRCTLRSSQFSQSGWARVPEKGVVEMQEVRGNKLEDIFRVSKKWKNTIDAYGIEALLRRYASKYTKSIALEIIQGPTNHEWGSGGSRESLYRLINDKKETLFEVSELEAWETYSDDSEDHPLPTTITVCAVPFMFEDLIQECLALLQKDQ